MEGKKPTMICSTTVFVSSLDEFNLGVFRGKDTCSRGRHGGSNVGGGSGT